MRAYRYIDPEDRRWLQENLICLNCGNDTHFTIDLRISHLLGSGPEGISVELNKEMIENVTSAIAMNVQRMLDQANWNGKALFRCANCSDDSSIEYEPRILDICYSSGCGGCWCHGYAERDAVIECCTECVKSRNGNIDDDDCEVVCDYAENSLRESREHHSISLDGLKRQLGYPV